MYIYIYIYYMTSIEIYKAKKSYQIKIQILKTWRQSLPTTKAPCCARRCPQALGWTG